MILAQSRYIIFTSILFGSLFSGSVGDLPDGLQRSARIRSLGTAAELKPRTRALHPTAAVGLLALGCRLVVDLFTYGSPAPSDERTCLTHPLLGMQRSTSDTTTASMPSSAARCAHLLFDVPATDHYQQVLRIPLDVALLICKDTVFATFRHWA